MAVQVLSLLALGGCTTSPERGAALAPIAIESVRVTAAGHYLDLRYRVLDAPRANELLGAGVKPVLVDQATGVAMGVPMTAKLGPLRQTNAVQKPDHLYFVMFVNTARLGPGSRVTARLGDIEFTDLVVD